MIHCPVAQKTLPNSLPAEQSVLACLLLDYVGCSGGLDKLSQDDFFSPAHKTIFDAMQSIAAKKNKNMVVDFVSVVESLTKSGKLESVGGVEYLNKIIDTVPSVGNFQQYFDIVKKNSILRKLNAAGAKIHEASLKSDDEQETLSEAEKIIFDIAKSEERKELTPMSEHLPIVLDRLDTIKNDPMAIYGVKTGFYGLDNLTNGLQKGELIILAARPGVGKTSLGLNMIMNAALKFGKRCAVFSLEMSKSQLVIRALCSMARVSSYHANRGELGDPEWTRLINASEALSSANVYIDDNSDITATEIRRKCMRLKREHGLDFVMVDYLGLMNPGAIKRDNRQVEVAANSRAMKILAKELEIPVLLLAQLNRNVETRTAKGADAKPALHDLRESGAIEQDADMVMFIHMPKPEGEEEEEPTEADLIIAKNRNGPTRSIKLAWNKESTTFSDAPKEHAAYEAKEKASGAKTGAQPKQVKSSQQQAKIEEADEL